MRNPDSRNKIIKKMNGDSVLTVLCAGTCSKVKKPGRSKRKIYSRKSMNSMLHVNTTANPSKELENVLNGERELYKNARSFCTPNEILGSTECCHHDDTLVDIDNARYPVFNTEQTCADARERIANYCCSIFNDEHQEYHICDREDYNADSSDFNAEMQTDWTAECFHPECIRAKGCRCFRDSNESVPDINMPYEHCPLMSRTARLFENSALSKEHQREEVDRLGSDELRPDIAPEFATEADEYSPGGVERRTDCDEKERRSARGIRKRVASKASLFAEPDVAHLPNSRLAGPRCEIDTRSRKRGWRTTTAVEKGSDRYKSDLLKGADTWDVRAWRDDCIERRCVVAEPSRSDRHPGEKGEFAREVDSEWKPDSIETDAQQLDYKWKRRITTVDAGTGARMDFKGKRDSR